MAKRKIKTKLKLHQELLKLVYDNGSMEVTEIKRFIMENYSFNGTTISTAYREFCNSGFISVITRDKLKFVVFGRNRRDNLC